MRPLKWVPIVLCIPQTLGTPVSASQDLSASVADAVSTATSAANLLTTGTSTWKTSSTSIWYQTPFGPNSRLEYRTTQTITQTSSRGIFPSYPATVVDHGTTTVDFYEAVTPGGTIPPSTGYWTSTYISATTYIVYRPEPTDMPAGTTLNNVPCGPCAPADWKSDPQCDALGLDTACQGQCTKQDGFWWCRHLTGLEIVMNPEYQMGRVCWGNSSMYHQLMTPCVNGDHQFECLACTGQVSGYNPTKWI